VKMSWSLADDVVVVVVAVVVGRGGRGVGGGGLVEPPEQQGVPALWVTRGWRAGTGREVDVETPLMQSHVFAYFSHCLAPVWAAGLSYRDRRGSSKKRADRCQEGREHKERCSHRLQANSPATLCAPRKLMCGRSYTYSTHPRLPLLPPRTQRTGTQEGPPCRRRWCWCCPSGWWEGGGGGGEGTGGPEGGGAPRRGY